jgi:hypothetical protein
MWMPETDDLLLWKPVETAGDRLGKRVRLAVDQTTGVAHLAFVGQYGDATTMVLRPADARRLGTALIEASALADGHLTGRKDQV